MQTAHIRFLDLFNGPVQYVVPRWQRRYRWGRRDIERLVDDLLAIAAAGADAAHYGGTLLTFPEPGAPAGLVTRKRVVDGQQRLTTVSVLLACIAEKLGPEGKCGDWNAKKIRDYRLTNPDNSEDKFYKLRLQPGDDEEYRNGLEGRAAGSGAVTQAWRIVSRLVAKNDTAQLLKGIERFKAVSIGLDHHEDPQQIFESLNATGQPLTESEKVKNWLLMGLPESEQKALHDQHWSVMEEELGTGADSGPTDIFLRDLLRWRTGELQGIDRSYEGLRRWALRQGRSDDRPAICRELARLAGLYGILTGTAGAHADPKVESNLHHLRELGIHVHRPLSLRLLDDAARADSQATANENLAKTLETIGVWLTRQWLADRPTAGTNKAMAELASAGGPGPGDNAAAYWTGRIRRLRNTRARVPSDDAVRRGILTRKACGGGTGRSAAAILSAMMEAEHREESPSRDRLTIEHIMPQKLTDEWKRELGGNAEEIHGKYRDRLANLTLSGDATNSALSAKTFTDKREIYGKSPIGLTSRLADETEWNEGAMLRRANHLADRALKLWPWTEPATAEQIPAANGEDSATFDGDLRWRINDGHWQTEAVASQMVLNVAGALLSLDPANAERLSGDAASWYVHPASRYPAGSKAGTLTMRAVPGHEDYVLYPYTRDYPSSAKRCRAMAELCGARIDVAGVRRHSEAQLFFRFLKERTGGLPGQKDSWRGASQWAAPANERGDRICISLGEEVIYLYIRTGTSETLPNRTSRLRRYSSAILNQLPDQTIEGELETESTEGRTVSLQRAWNRQDEADWPDAADWIKDQYERLHILLSSSAFAGATIPR